MKKGGNKISPKRARRASKDQISEIVSDVGILGDGALKSPLRETMCLRPLKCSAPNEDVLLEAGLFYVRFVYAKVMVAFSITMPLRSNKFWASQCLVCIQV